MIEDAGWELQWPPELLRREGGWLLGDTALRLPDWSGRVAHLLEEAFVGSEARDAFEQADAYAHADPFSHDYLLPNAPDGAKTAFLAEVVDRASAFRQATAPRPYWAQRRGTSEHSLLRPEDLRRRFVGVIEELERAGYLDQVFPAVCVDDRDAMHVNPSDILEDRLGVHDLWPVRQSYQRWDEDTFYGVIEVLHDLVARPRKRSWHDWNQCGWHWSEFARVPAQALYRWRVNDLLERAGQGLRIADDGEDTGRLVAVTDDARAELASGMAAREDPVSGDRVRHALALFRARGATEHDKRSAIVVLAGVLEERRDLLKAELFRKDEGALFQLANEFALRHRSESQKDDYDVAFLDWVFWWYLATIELSDRLLARQASGAP